MGSSPLNVPAKDTGAVGSMIVRRHHVDWAVQARTTILDAQRYTRFVAIMKRALLLAAGALLLAVLAYSLQPRDVSHFAMTFERMGRIANDLTMLAPRLTGSDSEGNPFVVTADRAIQDPKNIHRARLFNVEADISGKDGAWYNMRAPRGYLDSDAQKLWLVGKLAMFSAAGYELHTDAAFIDLAPSCDPVTGKGPAPKPRRPAPRCAKTTIRGDRVVTGQGPLGTLRADRFRISKGSRRLYLEGNVRTRLYPAQARTSSQGFKYSK